MSASALELETQMPNDKKSIREKREQLLKLKFKEERLYKGLTQSQLAKEASVQRHNVSDVEQGRSKDILTLWDLADGLGVPLGVIISRVDRAIEEREQEKRLGLVREEEE